ncbi:HPr family phosphocarrier protein [Oerskovia sp. M15]
MTTPQVGDRARIALVLVSHSRRLAQGAAELAAQMAPGVLLLPAGGTDDGSLGTSYDVVSAAVAEGWPGPRGRGARRPGLRRHDDRVGHRARRDARGRVVLADAPFVEGPWRPRSQPTAAAPSPRCSPRRRAPAARSPGAGSGRVFVPAAAPPSSWPEPPGSRTTPGAPRAVTLRNPLGLHARPAAILARLVAGYDAKVTINGVNAASVLEMMKLGATGGRELVIAADGPQASEARDAAVAVVEGLRGGLSRGVSA